MDNNLINVISLMNRMGENTIPNDIKETENKIIRIVEERGVAASPFKDVSKQIYNYVCKMAQRVELNDFNIYYIPEELTKKYTFVENLHIKVKITNASDKSSVYGKSGSGSLKIESDSKIKNGKIITPITISVNCYALNGILLGQTFLNSLYHEINHLYDFYNDLKNNNNLNRATTQAIKGNVNVKLFNDASLNELFTHIIYRLFTETEFNALVAQLYGELEAMNSERKNFAEDIKNTFTYQIYNKILKNYKSIYTYIDDNNIKQVKALLSSIGVVINPYGNSTESFVKELTRKTKWLLEKLLKAFGRTASLYYDQKEEKENLPTDNTIKIK